MHHCSETTHGNSRLSMKLKTEFILVRKRQMPVFVLDEYSCWGCLKGMSQ